MTSTLAALAMIVEGVALAAGAPSWALRDTERLEGHLFSAVCAGSGPGVGHARQEAIDSCKVSAAQHLLTEVDVRSMSIASEGQAAYRQEVVSRSRVSGLVCVPRREEIQEDGDRVKLWVLCEFDLSRARAVSVGAMETQENAPEPGRPDWISNRKALEGVESVRNRSTPENSPGARERVLTIAVIPMCTDVVVQGEMPARVVRCTRNPVSIAIDPADRQLLVRADGYFPKTILLAPSKDSRGYAKVVLEPIR